MGLQGCQQTQIWNPENCAGGQGGRTGPLAGPGQRPGGGPGGEAPGSSWLLREIKAQYAIS